MEYGRNRTWLEVDLSVLTENYRRIREHISKDADMIIVVKADAYGLGAIEVARTLEAAGCKHFATAYFEEASALREQGITSGIQVLGVIPPEYVKLAIEQNIEASLSDASMAEVYGKLAKDAGGILPVHIAADVGMSRFGIRLEDGIEAAAGEAERILDCPGICVKSLYSHVTGMEFEWQREFDLHQLELFQAFVDEVRSRGHHLKAHCSCSAITLLYPEYHMDFIRVSALPFGLQSKLYQEFELAEVIQLKSRIWYIKEVPRNTTVGYGPHYTKRKTRLAIIPVGFGDGLHRSISDRAEVLIHGKRARIFGKLCMDFTMVDITDIEDVKAGDEVVLFGKQAGAEISVFEYAGYYGGTACEVATSLGKRINRIYV